MTSSVICKNEHVLSWVSEIATHLQPEKVEWIDGSESESIRHSDTLVANGSFRRLNPKEFPSCFYARSHPNDVARVEERTFICSQTEDDAGPTNNWAEPAEMYRTLNGLMNGCMKGRIMYVVPYLMGPAGSPFSKVGFELTDSLYVVANMRIMARIGTVALEALGASSDFVKGIHSTGSMDPDKRYIAHFPDDRTIISFNSNYGGNALQNKKCFALRIASGLARREGWLAEHMVIMGITNPAGKKIYVSAAFPSACGKTNLAMLIPPPVYLNKGWKIETVGDDIAWLRVGRDGRLHGINPEAGFFGVAPGTSEKTNPRAMATIRSNTIFTNTALNEDSMTPWWEGLSSPPPKLRDWMGQEWTPESAQKAAHPNSRFTAPASQCPSIDSAWESPEGVPISAFIFGGRRSRTAPLIYQAKSWRHGTFMAVTMASETTAAASGKVGQLRRDPMAMLPFIGYHAGDYFQHWLDMEQRGSMPEVFHVNWFRTDSSGRYLWPGFGDNIRVLEWIFKRVESEVPAEDTPLGYLPRLTDINLEDCKCSPKELAELLSISPEEWEEELNSQREFFERIGPKMPEPLWEEHRALKSRLGI